MFKNLRSAGELSWNVQLRPDFVKVFEAQGFGLGIFICIHREKGPSIDRQIQPIQRSTENDWEIASETRSERKDSVKDQKKSPPYFFILQTWEAVIK
jgi:hypothetical protein